MRGRYSCLTLASLTRRSAFIAGLGNNTAIDILLFRTFCNTAKQIQMFNVRSVFDANALTLVVADTKSYF